MHALSDFLTSLSDLQRGALLVGGLGFFLTLESWRPLRRFEGDRWRHLRLNSVFLGLSILIHLMLARVVVGVSAWTAKHELGLLPWMQLPAVVEMGLGLLLLELIAAWWPHWLMHRVAWLWRWHLVHHSDPLVDATTGIRTHPWDVVVRLGAEAFGVGILGAPLSLIVLYECLVTLSTLFAHANVAVPSWLDASLTWLFVTPNFHRVHHHAEQPLTDRNYGLVFSVWDRVFRTCVQVSHPAGLMMGLDSHRRPDQHSCLRHLLASPVPPTGDEPSGLTRASPEVGRSS